MYLHVSIHNYEGVAPSDKEPPAMIGEGAASSDGCGGISSDEHSEIPSEEHGGFHSGEDPQQRQPSSNDGWGGSLQRWQARGWPPVMTSEGAASSDEHGGITRDEWPPVTMGKEAASSNERGGSPVPSAGGPQGRAASNDDRRVGGLQ
jgi:hypothetical protein